MTQAPVATTLNRQNTTGAVAHCAASEVARPSKSRPAGPEGAGGSVPSGARFRRPPRTSAPSDRVDLAGVGQEENEGGETKGLTRRIGRSRRRAARNTATTSPARTAGGFAPPTRRTEHRGEHDRVAARFPPMARAQAREDQARGKTDVQPETTSRW